MFPAKGKVFLRRLAEAKLKDKYFVIHSGAGTAKTRTAILLDDGSMIVIPMSVEVMARKMTPDDPPQ